MKRRLIILFVLIFTALFAIACTAQTEEAKREQTETKTEATENAEDTKGAEEETEEEDNINLIGKLQLSESSGRIGDKIGVSAEDLYPNEELQVIYIDMEGRYNIGDDHYSFKGTLYDRKEVEVASGIADENGKWEGSFTIPEGFGDDHDVYIVQKDEKVAKANLFVETVFTIEPESGPIGTEITIRGEGLSWKMYGSLWHVNYDNKYTGMLTGVSTNGTAEGVIRAAGSKGEHTITIESGSSGTPFMNRNESAINYISTHYFTFTITDDIPKSTDPYVEEPPEPADGGIVLPDPENKDGVKISLDKEEGTVGEKVTLTGEGLPENSEVVFDWHTMVGNRVTPEGFSSEVWELGKTKTDENGTFTYPFEVPDDLGGLPHLIDVKIGDEVVGQTYLRILPSIVSIEPKEGPPGTLVTVEIKGSGWTEYDNALAVTYDNASIGYICGFNSQGTIKLPFLASGESGYHVVDIYPSIYQGKMQLPDLYVKPQLTYRLDHPGTGIPALRTYFKATEE